MATPPQPGAGATPPTIEEPSLGGASPGAMDTVQEATASGPAVPMAPRRIEHFVLLQELGAGGMGVVFAAFDEKLERKVAIKLIPPRAGAQRSRGETRLLREAQALARLAHPNVVAVHEVGALADGSVFVAMEHVEGITLREWQQGQRDWRAVVAMYAQAGAGLAAAHQAGIVHRDVKPDNILVGKDGRARVVDFGLARAETAAAPVTPETSAASNPEPGIAAPRGRMPLTAAGAVLGTPGYMAPEQLRGGRVDARTDQFSFCVALHEALYGERPYPPLVFSLDDEQVAASRRPRPADVRARWLWAALERGLALDPALRWPSMTELIAELTRDHARRRRMLIAAAVVTGLIAATGATAMWLASAPASNPCALPAGEIARLFDGIWNAAERQRLQAALAGTRLPFARDVATAMSTAFDRYAAGWIDARRAACEATHVQHVQSDELLDRRVECLETRKRSLDAAVEALIASPARAAERSSEILGSLGDIDLCAEGDVLRSGFAPPADAGDVAVLDTVRARLAAAAARLAAGDLTGAEAELTAAERLASDLAFPPAAAELLHLRGRLQIERGEIAPGVATLRQAVDAGVRARHDELVADAWLSMARYAGPKHGQSSEAEGWVAEAERWLARLAHPGDARSIAAQHARAAIERMAGKHREALATLGRALAAGEAAWGGEDPRLVPFLRDRASVLAALGQAREARLDYERASTIGVTAWGAQHPEVARTRRALGLLMIQNLGEVAQGEREVEAARRILAASHGERSAEVANCEQVLSKAGMFRGDYAGALLHAERALAIYDELLGPRHRIRGEALMAVGVLRFMQQDLAGSLAAYEEALAVLAPALGEDNVDVGLLESNLGETLLALGRVDEAVARFERALATLRRGFGPTHRELALPLKGLGLAHLARRRPADAAAALEQALALRDPRASDPQELAEIRWALARALAALGKEPGRQRELAGAALAAYRDLGPEWADRVQEITRWLRSHR
jgi:tetratricopeptide (TPR) repeat protein